MVDKLQYLTLIFCILLLPATTRAAEAPPAFTACAACHNSQPDALGPDLRGVIGRTAGSLPGYRFSGPMRRSGLVWSKETLTKYLEDPQATVPGNRMPMEGLSRSDAELVTTYLQQLR